MTPTGDWIDLTWPLSPSMPRLRSFPPPRIERVARIPHDPLNVTELSMIVHIGTHVDSPRHFFSDGPALEDVPLGRLMGSGVVWSIDKPQDGLIERNDLQRMRPRLEPGDILLLDTGMARYVGTPDYDLHAALSVPAAHWLLDQELKLLAVDTPTPRSRARRAPRRVPLPPAEHRRRRRRAGKGPRASNRAVSVSFSQPGATEMIST